MLPRVDQLDGMRIPANRGAAAVRGVFLLLVASGLVGPALVIWPTLRFMPTATENRLGDYAIAWLLGLGGACGAVAGWRALRWFGLALAPGFRGFEMAPSGITADLGSFGTWRSSWDQMRFEWPSYLFDLDLPPDQPLPMRECPPMLIELHGARVRVDLALRRFGAVPEERWWPILEPWIRPALLAEAQRREQPEFGPKPHDLDAG